MTEAERKALLAQRKAVQRIALRLVYDAREVEDVVQEAWVAGWQQDSAPGTGWFARTVRNLALTRSRARQRRRLREEAAARNEAQPSTDEVVAKAEMQREVVDAVLALSEPYRTTILLRYFENLPPRRIAQRMEAPVDTVKTRLERGHRLLREALDRKHGSRRAWMGAFVPLLAARALAATGVALMAKKTLGIAAVLLLLAATVHFATRTGNDLAPPDRAAREEATSRRSERPPPYAAVSVENVISGRVTDASGDAVAGARIQVLRTVGPSHNLYGPPRLDQIRANWDRAHSRLPRDGAVLTDAQGRFTAAARSGCQLLVRATGFLARGVATPLVGPIVLDHRPRTMGVVLAPDGTPLEGARVHLLANRLEIPGDALALARAMTSADGRFEFAEEATGSDLLVEHADHPPCNWSLSNARTPEVTVRMSEWRTLNGRVLDAVTREPIDAADVYVTSSAGICPWSSRSGTDGSFEVRHGGLPMCMLVVDAGSRGNRMVRFNALSDSPLEVLLSPTVSLRGRVVGPPRGELKGLTIHCSQDARFTREARTDARGEFILEGIASDAGLHVVFDPWHEAWEPEEDAPEPAHRDRGALSPPFPSEITLQLKRKATLSGIVMDEAGNPIPGAVLDCREEFGAKLVYTYPRVRPAVTDEEGRFRLNSITTRFASLPISIRAVGFVLGRLDLPRLGPGWERSGEVIRLSRGLGIDGLVRYADGRPAEGVEVRAHGGRRGEMPPFDSFRSAARSGADGRYRIDTLPPGDYTVSVATGDEYLPVWCFGVPAGTSCDPLVLTAGHRIEGSVSDESGAPLAGVSVAVQTTDYRGANRVRTDSDGSFVAPQLEPGAYHVHFWLPGYLGHYERDVTVPRSKPIVVTLGKGNSISGMLLGADGKPVPSLLVRAERTAPRGNHPGYSGQGFSDRAGRFVITGLSEGEFKLRVEGLNRTRRDSFRVVQRVVAGSEVTLRAEQGTELEVHVVDTNGNRIRDVQLTVIAEEEKGASYGAARDERGVYRAGPLLGESFTILAQRGPECGFLEGVAAGSRPVTVVLGRGKTISGRLVDARGEPTEGNLSVTLKRLPHHTFHVLLRGTEGEFRLTGLPDGEFWIRATSQYSFAFGPSGTTVRAGDEGLEFVVPQD